MMNKPLAGEWPSYSFRQTEVLMVNLMIPCEMLKRSESVRSLYFDWHTQNVVTGKELIFGLPLKRAWRAVNEW